MRCFGMRSTARPRHGSPTRPHGCLNSPPAHAVLRDALAGTSKARLAYAPDWMLNLTARPVLRQLAGQIEQGRAVGDPMHGFQSQADWEASLPPEKQKQMQEWRQYDASRPMTDPDAAANKFLNGAN